MLNNLHNCNSCGKINTLFYLINYKHFVVTLNLLLKFLCIHPIYSSIINFSFHQVLIFYLSAANYKLYRLLPSMYFSLMRIVLIVFLFITFNRHFFIVFLIAFLIIAFLFIVFLFIAFNRHFFIAFLIVLLIIAFLLITFLLNAFLLFSPSMHSNSSLNLNTPCIQFPLPLYSQLTSLSEWS